jgi:ketosteroid isomerase-like protein
MTGPESLFEIYKNAVFQKDVEAFASIFDQRVRVFDMWVLWSYDGLVDWREMAKEWFGSLGTDRVVVSFDEIQIEATAEMATATAFVKFAALSEKGEETRYLQNRLTWVARKKEGNWIIFHQHTSGPIDFETMKVLLKRQ